MNEYAKRGYLLENFRLFHLRTEQTVTVPVCIAGNPGLMGMKLTFFYDATMLQPTGVVRGQILSGGMFSHNMAESGKIVIVWSGTADVSQDGELFLLQFDLIDELEKDTNLQMQYSQMDTFNSAWQDVVLCCEEITVEKKERPACDGGTTCPCYGYIDRPTADHWSHAGIDFVVEQGLMIGVSDTEFAPAEEFTRGMMVMVLYRMEGSPKVEASNEFADVPQTEWYAQAVAWAAEQGVVKGYGDGTFKPNGAITREEIAIMFCRYAKLSRTYEEAEESHLETFPDGETVSPWAVTELNWAVDTGLINGVWTEEGTFLLPLEHANREQLATILMRFLSE